MSSSQPDAPSGAYWKQALEPYTRPTWGRSAVDLLTSLVAYVALSAAMFLSLRTSVAICLALSPLAAGFLLRTYIIFHDCCHGSFLPHRRANAWLGGFLGVVVLAPFANWRHNHAVHHATSGDLDRRGQGDVPTLTVAEYLARPWRGRLAYRLFRHPLVMFGIGPLFAMILAPRIVPGSARPRIRRSVHLTNLALAVGIGLLCWLMGPLQFLVVWLPGALLAGSAGIWLFYVQHQFEDAYWERNGSWSYADAALRGSSHLRLPQPLQFFTGNIGLHHVHHLSARIPNYNLQRAHDENPIFNDVPTITMREGLRAVRLKLWDEDAGRLVTFAEVRMTAPSGAQPSGAAA